MLSDARVAVLRAANAAMVMAVDPGAAAERPHFVGKTHTVRIERGTGLASIPRDGGEGWQAVLTVEDADHRPVYRAGGLYECGG